MGGGVRVVIVHRVSREDHSEQVTFRPGRGSGHTGTWEGAPQAEVTEQQDRFLTVFQAPDEPGGRCSKDPSLMLTMSPEWRVKDPGWPCVCSHAGGGDGREAPGGFFAGTWMGALKDRGLVILEGQFCPPARVSSCPRRGVL